MADREKQEQRVREVLKEKQDEARVRAEENQLNGSDRTQDDPDPRTKNSGHKKKTADKWNQ